MNSVVFQNQTFVPVGTSVGLTELDGEQLIRVVKPEENTEPDVPTYARLVGSNFHDGTIELDVRARLMHWADIDCRGFIGFVFRASEDDDRFDMSHSTPLGGRASGSWRSAGVSLAYDRHYEDDYTDEFDDYDGYDEFDYEDDCDYDDRPDLVSRIWQGLRAVVGFIVAIPRAIVSGLISAVQSRPSRSQVQSPRLSESSQRSAPESKGRRTPAQRSSSRGPFSSSVGEP